MNIGKYLDKSRYRAGLLRRINNLGLMLPVRQVGEFGTGSTRILVVASGSLHIPSDGWGAVEKVISETIPLIVAEGYYVTLLNSKHRRDWAKVSAKKYQLIICHDDATMKKVSKYFPSTPKIAVTHYGFLQNVENWDQSFQEVFKDLVRADVIVALSEVCASTIGTLSPGSSIEICPNGIQIENYRQFDIRKRAIYLGKVEERKRQIEISRKYPNLEIDFVGPCSPTSVTSEIMQSNGARFLGPKNKKWLRENLASYQVGILMSKSEADALVLYEYQNAGLKVLVSEGAKGAQDTNLPWIQVSEFESLSADLKDLSEKEIDPLEIISHSIKYYSWENRIHNYLNLISKVIR